MRNLRKLLFAAAAFALAVALWASPASAQEPVEIMNLNEDGAHCPAVTITDHWSDDGCHREMRSTSGVTFVQHRPTGDITVITCTHTLEPHLDENGEGWIQDIKFFPGSVACGTTFTPCTAEGVVEPWHFQISHNGLGDELMTIEACYDLPISPGVSCEILGDLQANLTNLGGGDYGLEAEDKLFAVESSTAHGGAGACGFLTTGQLEVFAHFDVEDEGEMEEEHNPNASIQIEHL